MNLGAYDKTHCNYVEINLTMFLKIILRKVAFSPFSQVKQHHL